jgi:hypothetical protein
MGWYDREKQLEQLGFIGQAESYEVDQWGIFFDPIAKDFVVITATGCSCWDSEFDEEHFPSLDEVEKSLMKDNRDFNPTLKGLESLMAEARQAWIEREQGGCD